MEHSIENVTVSFVDECHACAIRPSRISLFPSVRIADQDDIILETVSEMNQERYYVTYKVYELYLHQREALLWLWSVHCQDTLFLFYLLCNQCIRLSEILTLCLYSIF